MALQNTVDRIALVQPTARGFGLTSLLQMARLAHQRRSLAKLDAAALADLGLSQADARSEAARPFWDVPAHWKG